MKRIQPIKQVEIVTSNLERSAPQTSNEAKPLASLSLDLDNKWTYMKTHGDPGWERFPSYLDTFVPMVLDILDDLNLKITFFIVGQDAALEKNQYALKLIPDRGHEVGNHSFNHEPWLHLYPKNTIREEVLETEKHILKVTGKKTVGFRGPGFSSSSELIEVLLEHKYLYDASSLPTYLGPFARAYYMRKSELSNEEREKRKMLFGTFKDGLKPNKPHYLKSQSGDKIAEIPVTTVPIFKTPFHLSYLIYISSFSMLMMVFYVKMAITLCRISRISPSFLLHPLDFLDSDSTPGLSFFPGMNMSKDLKLRIFNKVIKIFSKHFNFCNIASQAASIIKQSETSDAKIPLVRSIKQII